MTRRRILIVRLGSGLSNIAIVGGGIGGLTAALALLREGIDVDVYEQADELKEVGAGVQISANGTRVLFALGLKEAVERVSWMPAAKEIRLWNTGQTWKLDHGGVRQRLRRLARGCPRAHPQYRGA